MEHYDSLHLANNLDSLNLLALKDFDIKNLKSNNTIYNLLRKCLDKSKKTKNQEEIYIFLVRYIKLYEHLKSFDEEFVQKRYTSEYKKVVEQFEKIKQSLEQRYVSKPIPTKPKEPPKIDKPQRVFTDQYITCQQLFGALNENCNLLLVDARPESDFAESRLNYENLINVPDHCITAGLSANVLGKALPPETQKFWNKRGTYQVVVLFDWDTTKDNFNVTKLNHLRSALVDWDFNCNYKEPPVILNGGYLEILQMYPTKCINPQVYLFQKNGELDDLLNLDNIEYPTESDRKNPVMGLPEDIKEPKEADVCVEEPTSDNMEILLEHRNSIVAEIECEERKRNEYKRLQDEEVDIKMMGEWSKKTAKSDAEIKRMQAYRHNIDKQIDLLSNAKHEEPEPENKEAEREEALKKARSFKPLKVVDKPVVPFVNRANKPHVKPSVNPYVLSPLPKMNNGLVGLRNIRNTCYMNTVVQCLRHIPTLTHLFCRSNDRFTIKIDAGIIYEVISLFREMWSTEASVVTPDSFYRKITKIEQNYLQGNHEDCMEFFLFLLNQMCDDTPYNVAQMPKVLTQKQLAWHNQFEGKNSRFIDLFYHQIKISQECSACPKKSFKFDIESSFMLPIPETDFDVEELMMDYMSDYVIPESICANCKIPVTNSKEWYYMPNIIVIVLKRYKQLVVNGKMTFRKLDCRAHFGTELFLSNECYKLSAVALHSGTMDCGHYTAACLTSDGWYEFNDEQCKKININDEAIKTKACAFFYSTKYNRL